MKLFSAFALLTICFTATGQTIPPKAYRGLEPERYSLTDSQSGYTDSTGRRVTIHNSLPRGGGRYTDAAGRTFSYVIFWTRVINETDTPLALSIEFPADSFPILHSSNAYLKLFLPPGTMTFDKISLYDYGVTGLESFLETHLNRPANLQRTINGNAEYLFNVGMLLYEAEGPVRSGFVLENERLFYKINLLDNSLIPFGRIAFKDR